MPVTVAVRSASGDARGGEPGAAAPSLTFDGDRILVGRGPGSDVRLPDPSVSLRHATIRVTGVEYAIVDEGSTNGTFVGGVRLLPRTPRVVRTGDLVRVGRVWLEVSLGPKAPTPDLGLATRDLALALVRQAMDVMGDDTVTRIRVVEGPDMGAELRLVEEGRIYIVGRADTCDLPLADPDASREHAHVVRRGATVLVKDLGSRNGVLLGDNPIDAGRDVVWRPPAMARLARTVLAIDEPVGIVLAELESLADEPLREEDAPPSPIAHAAPAAPAATADPEPAASRPSSAAALIAAAATPSVPPVRPSKRGWTATDFFVITLAVALIGASLAGLVWVLR